MNNKNNSFWLWSAIFLAIWSMVWAWIFVLLWEAWTIAWNLVWISFLFWWIIALLSGYSMAKLAWLYPSRWWIVEYLVQCYWEWIFSWTITILFYISGMIALSMVAKTFWTYTSVLFWLNPHNTANIFAVFIIILFVLINLIWSKLMAKSENSIVIFKLSILIIFTLISLPFIHPKLLEIQSNYHILNIFSAIWLTFFAYEWFRVITNTAEDIENPNKNILKAIIYSILFVIILYILITISVFWTLNLNEIIKAKDYALAEAVKPIFWEIWFTLMWIAALVSTSSSINANLYAITNVTYDMAKNWQLPKIYKRNVYHSFEWLIISSIIIIIFTIFFNLSVIASIGAILMLFIHLLVHIWHLFKIKETHASKILVYLAIITIIITIVIAYKYMSIHIKNISIILLWSIWISFMLEIILRLLTHRIVKKQTHSNLISKIFNK